MVGLYSYSGQLHHILLKNIGIYHVAVCAEVVGVVQYSSTNKGGADLTSGRFLFYQFSWKQNTGNLRCRCLVPKFAANMYVWGILIIFMTIVRLLEPFVGEGIAASTQTPGVSVIHANILALSSVVTKGSWKPSKTRKFVSIEINTMGYW